MESIRTYHIPVTEQHIRDGFSDGMEIPIPRPEYPPQNPPRPLELAFGNFFQEQENTCGYVDWERRGTEAYVREASVSILNPDPHLRNETQMITIVADESVIEWVQKFCNTKRRKRADNIPPITIRARIDHRTGEGVMAICETVTPEAP